MTKPFFITGLVRSRTAWLSNFLTTGDSFCFHDAGAKASSFENLLDRMNKVGSKFVGNSDTCFPFYVQEVIAMESPRIVVVRRNPDQCRKSFEKTFFPMDDSAWRIIHAEFETMLDVIKNIPHLEIAFKDLGNEEAVKEVFEYCCPGLDWDGRRFKLLQGFNVQIQQLEKGYQPDHWLVKRIAERRMKWPQ